LTLLHQSGNFSRSVSAKARKADKNHIAAADFSTQTRKRLSASAPLNCPQIYAKPAFINRMLYSNTEVLFINRLNPAQRRQFDIYQFGHGDQPQQTLLTRLAIGLVLIRSRAPAVAHAIFASAYRHSG
jgi:hypothetical protein